MLTELRVRDLGVIEDLTLEFGPGMTALTGETGAGKTLVVEALQLVLGGRANAAMVRAGAAEALVEARFVVPDVENGVAQKDAENDQIGVIASADGAHGRAGGAGGVRGVDGSAGGVDGSAGGVDGSARYEGADEREVIVARSVPASGRSKAWLDGRMTPVGTLAESTAELVELHGQHEHQSLTTAVSQRQVLDAFAGTDLERVNDLRARRRALDRALAELGGDEQQRAREADVLRYQVDEIAAARLDDPDEEASLRLEEERLGDAGTLRDAAALAAELIDPSSGEGGALDPLGHAAGALAGHGLFEDHRARLATVAAELSDLARTLRDEVETLEDDPERLAEVQERRRLLAGLRRKYGEDLRAVVSFAEEAALRLASLEDAEGIAIRLGAERDAMQTELEEAEAAVRAVRGRAAGEFGEMVEGRLSALDMPGARLEVRVAPQGTGEPVELALGANVGEPVQPLARIASGGELARAMLAIRLVGPGGPGTMVFDEVDAGVGGSAAVALALALHEVSRSRQVIVVTHLAQVASRADVQIRVVKHERDGRTVTTATPVTGEERVTELSRMLSGHPRSDAARAHARELLDAPGEPASTTTAASVD
jgi:DNA repair protein RecN (Recombination protein N)